MASLSDPFAPVDQQFVDLAAAGYNLSGRWPVWQFVQLSLQRRGVDALETYHRLPTWQHNYRPVNLSSGNFPEPATETRLTATGMAHVSPPLRNPRIDLLLEGFLAALRIANTRAREVEPDPTTVLDATLKGADLTIAVNKSAGTSLSTEQLYGLLSREPPFWGSLRGSEGLWSLELLHPWISRCAGVESIDDYLERIEALVGWPAPESEVSVDDPFALVNELDHLDLAWRLTAGGPLLRIPRATLGAKLAREVSTSDEFESCLTALYDILASLNIEGNETGTLQKLKARISEIREGGLPGTTDPIDVLRKITVVRNGAQHQAAGEHAVRARADLGLAAFGSDPASSWRQIRAIAARAVRQIREELEALIR